jgi:hypothetical protein
VPFSGFASNLNLLGLGITGYRAMQGCRFQALAIWDKNALFLSLSFFLKHLSIFSSV